MNPIDAAIIEMIMTMIGGATVVALLILIYIIIKIKLKERKSLQAEKEAKKK